MPKLVVNIFCCNLGILESDLLMEFYGGLGGKKVITRERRWYKDIGLGYKTPQEAINGTYIGQLFALVV